MNSTSSKFCFPTQSKTLIEREMSSSSSSIAPEEGDAVRVNVSLLPGFRFAPTDELLVNYYLKNKIEGTDSHFRDLIPEIDVWKFEPCDLPAFFPEGHEKDGFFFTRPKYKDTNSTRRDRLTHQGYYKVTGDERDIRAEESKAVIGKKIILTFYEGRGPKAKKSDRVIHELYCTQTEVGSKPTKQMDFVVCRLKNKSASYKKPKGDLTRGELADSGANLEDDQAAASNVIAEPVEHLGCKELEHVNSSESPDGSCLINWNDILNFFCGDDETGGRKVSDFDDPAASDMFQELCSALGEIPNSTSQLQQPLQTPQPHQPSQTHQPQDYYPSTHQPPLHTTQDYYPSTLQPPKYIISTNDPNEPVSKPNGVQDLATDEMISEDWFHPDEFMGPPFDPIQDSLLPSPINMELGDGVHPNNCIGCGELADSGANPEDDQAAASDVIAGPVEHLGYKELGDVNSSESPDGYCPINWNDILTIFYGDDETGGWKVSDVEFCSALGEIPNSTSQLLQPPQTPEPHQPPHSHQPQDYYPSTHQPPLHTTQDYYPSIHQPPEYIMSTNDPNEPVSKPNGVQDLATDEMIPEDCFHPDEFMGLPFDPSQYYLLLSPMNMELGDGVHPNNLYWMH